MQEKDHGNTLGAAIRMRTAKRATCDLIKDKLDSLHGICGAFAAAQRYRLQLFSSNAAQARIETHREARNEEISAGYRLPNGVQEQTLNLALVDAARPGDKYLQAMLVELCRNIPEQDFVR